MASSMVPQATSSSVVPAPPPLKKKRGRKPTKKFLPPSVVVASDDQLKTTHESQVVALPVNISLDNQNNCSLVNGASSSVNSKEHQEEANVTLLPVVPPKRKVGRPPGTKNRKLGPFEVKVMKITKIKSRGGRGRGRSKGRGGWIGGSRGEEGRGGISRFVSVEREIVAGPVCSTGQSDIVQVPEYSIDNIKESPLQLSMLADTKPLSVVKLKGAPFGKRGRGRGRGSNKEVENDAGNETRSEPPVEDVEAATLAESTTTAIKASTTTMTTTTIETATLGETTVKVIHGQGKPAAASMRTVLAGARGRKFQIPRPIKKSNDMVQPLLDESSIPLKKRKLMKQPLPEETANETSANTSSCSPLTDSIEDDSNSAASKKLVRKRRQVLPHNLKVKKTNGLMPSKTRPEDTSTTSLSSCDDIMRKRKYWRAGIYSSTFKEEIGKKKIEAERDFEEDLSEIPVGGLLPFPIHAGVNLCEEWFDFELPFDVWWQHTHSQLSRKVDQPKFRKIRQNIYIDVRASSSVEENTRCSCKCPIDLRGSGCGDDCLNRIMQQECSPETCPCGERCSNQRLQKRFWISELERFMTQSRGWGIRTNMAIKHGEFIMEYLGEVISMNEFWRRAHKDYQHCKHHYFLMLDSGTVIDGYSSGSEARFVNHSCEPNCEMQKWYVNGVYRIGMFALRDIPSGEELTYDYNFHAFNLETQVQEGGNKTGAMRIRKLQIPKPMSMREMNMVADRRIFLLRNMERVKRIRLLLMKKGSDKNNNKTAKEDQPKRRDKVKDVFLAQFTALKSPRSVKTRRLAEAEENSEVTKVARLAQVFQDIYTAVCTYQNKCGQNLAIPFMNLPKRKGNIDYYQRMNRPIDLSTIERNIMKGHYKSVEAFDDDFQRVFKNAMNYHSLSSELYQDADELHKAYLSALSLAEKHFEDILGTRQEIAAKENKDKETKVSSKEEEEEEVIRCLCGLYIDEGLMIQCEKCLVWQHCDCLGTAEPEERYLCEQCDPRTVPQEIVMKPQPKNAVEGYAYFLCLVKDDGLRVKQGDCVYLAPDYAKQGPESAPVHTQPVAAVLGDRDDLPIFRVEKLWKDSRGEKYAFGHHFLRPHETHHTPSRKFFRNEIFRVPFYEIIKLDQVVGIGCVMDLYTYCKGRPKGVLEQDVHICEYRLDKTAHSSLPSARTKAAFVQSHMRSTSLTRNSYPRETIRLENFAPMSQKEYLHCQPHDVPEHFKRGSGGRPAFNRNKDKQGVNGKTKKPEPPLTPAAERKLAEERRLQQKENLNNIMIALLDKAPTKQRLDLSFLLEDRKRRGKRPPIALDGFYYEREKRERERRGGGK
ncbi:putative histone-lysine N-methyltransferase ASH1L-like [Apostichopus japonicus]|uniref:Putative histone-lysine N-methyltransferase ASH1L-like n=1 Tax=Stichopus japonicus TaxID=307972 RepID=A0A2G8JTQ8_STIJA|nr:putative histone-lysine N-methyltransferase ASH1L-like [Apostichopus japonicus]